MLSPYFAKSCYPTAFAVVLLGAISALGARPTAQDALKLRPIQQDVDYDKPDEQEQSKCTIRAEQSGGDAAWTVRGPGGRLLRRFVDTNSDNKVDLWCYYKNGIEVYRDVDADFNGKADQYRWLGTAGTRWGLDTDQDGKIDAWKTISAEEVSAEAVAALRTGDGERFARLLITPEEQKSLKLGPEKAGQLSEKVASATELFTDLAKRQALLPKSAKWLHFGGALPGVVPAGTDGSEKDVTVYENVVAIVESDEGHRQVYIGTLVQVGGVWRLIEMPQVLDRDESPAVEGFFFAARAPQQAPTDVPATTNQAVRDAIAELEKIDKQLATAAPNEHPKIHKKRADVLETIIDQTTDQEQRSVWIRQYADTVSAAAQDGSYPEGVRRLQNLLDKLEKEGSDENVLASVEYPLLETSYAQSLQGAEDTDYPKIQEKWLEDLKQFVKDYPSSPKSADAMVQLALSDEFAAKQTEAKAWYTRIMREFPDSQQAKMAAGALKRIDCQGKKIDLQGKSLAGGSASLSSYAGKVTVVQYWATWCDACKKDMETLRKISEKYGSRFTVIGVNLDANREDAVRYIQQNRVPWVQLHEPGGMHSRLATEFGILSLPTTLLVDSQGKVVNRNIHVSQIEEEVKKLIR